MTKGFEKFINSGAHKFVLISTDVKSKYQTKYRHEILPRNEILLFVRFPLIKPLCDV